MPRISPVKPRTAERPSGALPTIRAATATASLRLPPSRKLAPRPSRRPAALAAGDVEPAEAADPVEDANDQPTPQGAAYEVEISKDGRALKVFLDSSFKVIETQQDAG